MTDTIMTQIEDSHVVFDKTIEENWDMLVFDQKELGITAGDIS